MCTWEMMVMVAYIYTNMEIHVKRDKFSDAGGISSTHMYVPRLLWTVTFLSKMFLYYFTQYITILISQLSVLRFWSDWTTQTLSHHWDDFETRYIIKAQSMLLPVFLEKLQNFEIQIRPLCQGTSPSIKHCNDFLFKRGPMLKIWYN